MHGLSRELSPQSRASELWHLCLPEEAMESVASCSPPPRSHGEVARPIASTSNAIPGPTALVPLARFGIQPVETCETVRSKEDERDDAHSSTNRWGPNAWKPADRKPSTFERAQQGGRSNHNAFGLVETRQHESQIWNHSNDWYTSRSRSTFAPYQGYERHRRQAVGMIPVIGEEVNGLRSGYGSAETTSSYSCVSSSQWSREYPNFTGASHTNSTRGGRSAISLPHSSRVVIPKNIVIPKAIVPHSNDTQSPADESIGKRSSDSSQDSTHSPRSSKRPKIALEPLEGRFDKLDLLCSATLELGPLQDNPTGCSCPKSKCIALYCDCFKAGRRCDLNTCTCLNCKNTVAESGLNGARSKAIQAILARNPRAFTNAGGSSLPNKIPPGENACNCIRSRCLKLYCTCFQTGKVCNPKICTCVGCLNTEDDSGGMRRNAIESTLEKRPDAFKQKNKVKEIGSGCACKNNKCIRKYCECFRTQLACSKKCSCRDCENQSDRETP